MRVLFYPFQPHCFAFGGFDMQMINALEAVKKQNVDAMPIDIWDRNNNFDVLHLWGVDELNYHLIDWSKKANKKVMATLLLPYFGTYRARLGHIYRILFSRTFKKKKQYLNKLDQLIVVNDIQARVLRKYYKIPAEKISIIPNIVEKCYLSAPVFNFAEYYHLDNYILTTGNVCPRKNQLNLAKACIELNLPLIIIGGILDGESDYANDLSKLIENRSNILWVKELPKASEELISAYYHCKVFALPSLDETQPISALEALSLNKRILLLDKPYAHQSYFKNAVLSKNESPEAIRSALEEALNKPEMRAEFNYEFSEESVGQKYANCYQKLSHGV